MKRSKGVNQIKLTDQQVREAREKNDILVLRQAAHEWGLGYRDIRYKRKVSIPLPYDYPIEKLREAIDEELVARAGKS